jgi:hypothetical protein
VSALAFVDNLLHRLHVPERLWWRLCDAHDLSLGVEDTPENFPRRHGYYREQHLFTGSSVYPEAATCRHCGRPIEARNQPCVLRRRP